MHPFLRITRYPYEEPHIVNLVVSAGDGTLQGGLEIYADAEDLKNAADALAGFPKADEDVYTWELGSENEQDRFAFYFRFRVFQISVRGRCAIELRFNNNQPPPDQKITEFCIEAYPADLDRLSNLFKKFQPFRRQDNGMDCSPWNVM